MFAEYEIYWWGMTQIGKYYTDFQYIFEKSVMTIIKF